MAREELLKYGKDYLSDLITACCKIESLHLNFVKESIKALEQEDALDKAKAEMLEEILSHSGTGEEAIQAYADGLKKGLEILDKYIAKDKGLITNNDLESTANLDVTTIKTPFINTNLESEEELERE